MKHPRRQSTQRHLAAIEEARDVLRTIAAGDCDLLLAYRQLYGIYLTDSGMVQELKRPCSDCLASALTRSS